MRAFSAALLLVANVAIAATIAAADPATCDRALAETCPSGGCAEPAERTLDGAELEVAGAFEGGRTSSSAHLEATEVLSFAEMQAHSEASRMHGRTLICTKAMTEPECNRNNLGWWMESLDAFANCAIIEVNGRIVLPTNPEVTNRMQDTPRPPALYLGEAYTDFGGPPDDEDAKDAWKKDLADRAFFDKAEAMACTNMAEERKPAVVLHGLLTLLGSCCGEIYGESQHNQWVEFLAAAEQESKEGECRVLVHYAPKPQDFDELMTETQTKDAPDSAREGGSVRKKHLAAAEGLQAKGCFIHWDSPPQMVRALQPYWKLFRDRQIPGVTDWFVEVNLERSGSQENLVVPRQWTIAPNAPSIFAPPFPGDLPPPGKEEVINAVSATKQRLS